MFEYGFSKLLMRIVFQTTLGIGNSEIVFDLSKGTDLKSSFNSEQSCETFLSQSNSDSFLI
jgi:hypothetical protein